MFASFFEAFDWERRDKRMDDFPMMSSFGPTLTICLLYVYLSKVAGPAFMATRRPIDVRVPLMVHNVVQIIGSTLLCWGFLSNGWLGDYNWICQDVDRNPDPNSIGYRMARVGYLSMLFRYLDLADTFFFLAKKKFSHVSNLQVVHHFLIPTYGWIMLRFVPGGNDSFCAVINFFVHIVMYTYYFIASLGPQYKKYIWWKKYLTQLQIGQFVICFLKVLPNVVGWTNCGYPWQFSLLTLGFFTLMLFMFAEFYVNEYRKPATKRKADQHVANGGPAHHKEE